MTVQESLNALGQWEIDLKPTIPRETMDALTYFGHVAIIRGRVDPTLYGDNLLRAARYVGVLTGNSLADDARTKIPNDNVKVSGVGMAMWLGDQDNKGSVYENAVVAASATFADTIRMLLPSSGAVTEGTLYPVAGQYTGTHQWQTPREAIQYVCQTMSTTAVPVSWRVNGDGTLDAGPESNLFVTTPTCTVVARGAGDDMAMRGIPGSLDLSSDVEDYTTRVVLLAEGEGTSIATGSADLTPATAYKDIHGNVLKMTRLVSESDTASANAATRAQLALSQYTAPKQDLRLNIQDYDVEGSFKLGDYVYAYDPDKQLYDPNVEIVFRGQRLNPIKLQVTEISWGVTADYTVAYRDATGRWYDLTDHIETSDAGTYVTVGGFDRALNSTGEALGSRPNADTSTPGQPVFLTPFLGTAYLDARGFTRARVVLNWNAPNNTDGSSILDGDHYEIRYAVDTDMLYPASWAAVSQVRWQDLQIWSQPFAAPNAQWQTMVVGWDTTTAQLQDLSPGIGYDVQIRAVDKTGNTGAWSPVTTFVASTDNIPPSTPAAPTVAGSRIAVQVTHTLGRSSGGTYNLESDLDHLEIHVSYEPTFTPSATTLKGKALATAGMMQAQIPVVFTAQVDETSARYVRVVAVDKTGNKSGPSDAATATALLIDDAHISDLSVSKVTAGTINADFVLGARIKTADSGPRAELSSLGVEVYDATGTRTFFADASTGDVSVVGQVLSGTSGKRLEINPTSTRLPEIRFYANSGTNYAFINAISGGTDSSLGMNGSSYDDSGTLTNQRIILGQGIAQYEVVRTSDGQRRGAYLWQSPGAMYAGHNSGGADGGLFYADTNRARIAWNPSDANANYMDFSNTGRTSHVGKWANFLAAGSSDGIFTGQFTWNFGTSGTTGFSITYGPTMDSTMIPICTFRFGNSAIRYGQVTANNTSGFTYELNSLGPSSTNNGTVGFWVYRV
ncbi:fibronectin type III domain-containing protein [Streptomyces sp. 1222.5]|uniref:fibronectin type III domain-containing protein n=1 Tax=Streptomyces sp. 1222.5 TaxID=1881026 RepID=UPI003EBB443A